MPGSIATTVYAAAVVASFGAAGIAFQLARRPAWAATTWPFVAAASAASVLAAPAMGASIALAATVTVAAAFTVADGSGLVTLPRAVAPAAVIMHVGVAAALAWAGGATVAAVTCSAVAAVCGVLLWT